MILLRFYLWLIGITLLQIGVIYVIPNYASIADGIKVIVFMAIVTGAIHPIANVGFGSKSGHTFIISAYLTIGIRFLLALAYAVYYKLTHNTYETGFILTFFATYIFYTIFEIITLTAKLRPDLNGKKSTNEFDK
ncbi:MAG: hypothetical protein ACK5UI_02025 [Bacteroidota bacterium]|jgi:hypothetical protein